MVIGGPTRSVRVASRPSTAKGRWTRPPGSPMKRVKAPPDPPLPRRPPRCRRGYPSAPAPGDGGRPHPHHHRDRRPCRRRPHTGRRLRRSWEPTRWDLIRGYLLDAHHRNLISSNALRDLLGDLGFPVPGAAPVPPPRPAPAAAAVPPPPPPPVVRAPQIPAPPAPRPASLPAPLPAPRPAGVLATWWSRRREAISADLAVHGLAYLGVLLIFTGVFGFVVFAFGSVETALRPLAELPCRSSSSVPRRSCAEGVRRSSARPWSSWVGCCCPSWRWPR